MLAVSIGQKRKLVKTVIDVVGTIADNLYYFYRIGCFKFSSKAADIRLSRWGTIPTIINYTLDIFFAYYDASCKAGNDRQLLNELLQAKKLFFLTKLSEYPMQIYYLDIARFPV